MNSTTSTDQQLSDNIQIGDEFYIPFWILLPFLDTAPPDPFIKVSIADKKWNTALSPDGKTEIFCCDLHCVKPYVMAHGIPASYLIKPEDLVQWADKIAAWFRDFPKRFGDIDDSKKEI